MMNFLTRLQRGFNPAMQVISVALDENGCRWVYGQVGRGKTLHFKSILASGGVEGSFVIDPEQKKLSTAALSDVLGKVQAKVASKMLPKPTAVVLSIPAGRALMCELVADEDATEEDLRFQIDDLLSSAAGDQADEMAYDWQPKFDSHLSDQGQALVVAAVLRDLMDDILLVCREKGLLCLGVTLDSVAAVNGYLQASSASHRQMKPKFLLYGEICPHRVRLAVFIEGFLCHESQDFSEQGFSVVQSVSSLEKLVGTWGRGDLDQGEGTVRLIVGGELMSSKTAEATIKRSRLLANKLFDVRPLPQLTEHWHADVVAYGALEGMPCE